jgi:hypothetical protein
MSAVRPPLVISVLAGLAFAACSADSSNERNNPGDTGVAAGDVRPSQSASTPATPPPGGSGLPPNEMGRIPVLEYHLIGDRETMWMVEREHFKRQLQLLYDRGYRPVTMKEVIDKKIDLPMGFSPVVFTFDDASPEQFSWIERDGKRVIDPNSAVGIWMAFHEKHPDWSNKAVFCTLSGAGEGHNFFGDKNIKGQKTEWRHEKVKWLADQGFEICNHTLWHAQLSKYPDAFVQEQIARGQMSIDSAVPGYKVRTFALPQGLWPKNRPLAWKGSWTDPKSGKTVSYDYDVVLEVAGGPARSPYDPKFNPKSTPRVIVHHDELEKLVEQLDKNRSRYVSDGDPSKVTAPPATTAGSDAGDTTKKAGGA